MESNADTNVERLISFGQMALEQGWYDQAREHFEQALELDASSEEAWLQLAKLTDDADEALTCLDRVLSINPQNVEARRMIDRLRRQKDPEELRVMLQIAMETGNKQAVRSLCSEILSIDPSDEHIWITLGRSCDDWDEALSHFRKALAINPENKEVKAEIERILKRQENHYRTFAKGAIESGDEEQADKYLRKVLEVNPNNEQAWLELAELASEPEEALGYLEHVLGINPANERARAAIRQTKEQQEIERLRVRQELEQARAEREAERLRAKQELEQVRAEEELARLEHLIYRSDEPVEPSPRFVWKRSFPSAGRIALIGIALVCGFLAVWFVATHSTLTQRQAIDQAQLATVGIGISDGKQCIPLGSGAVIGSEGLIVTNAHVVDSLLGNFYCISCTKHLEGETQWCYNAQVLRRDTLMDLALLKVGSYHGGTSASNLSLDAVPMGDSDEVHTGDTVYVCGYPGVGGQNVTVTQGLVSGFEKNRTWIKTDTEISPGSSGGVAITEKGLLIGIPTAVEVDTWTAGRIGYLIAVNEVQRFLQYYRTTPTPTPLPTSTPQPTPTPTPSKGREYYDVWDAHTLAWNDAIALGWETQDGVIIAMAIQELQKLHREWQTVDPPRAYETFHEKTLIYEESVIDMYFAISRRASQSTVDELFEQVEENRRIAERFMPYRFQYYANEK